MSEGNKEVLLEGCFVSRTTGVTPQRILGELMVDAISHTLPGDGNWAMGIAIRAVSP